MPNEVLTIGTLFVAHECLQHDKWMLDQAISAALLQLNKYKGLDGFLLPSRVRKGDYSLLMAHYSPTPIVVTFLGIPGRAKAPIIQELYVKR